MLIDTNCFVGPWPFLPAPARTGRELAAHLARHGIGGALVSHLGAVFLPEPMPANRELFRTTRSTRRLVPIPILNPALAAWRDHLDECIAAAPLRAVRILPAYHNYSLSNRRLDGFMAALGGAGVPVILQARLEDERNRYSGLTVQGLRAGDVAGFLRRFPEQHTLCCGLYRGEIEQLAGQCDNFSADFTFAEYLRTVESLLTKLPARRLLIGTGTPLLSTHAQTAKLRHARIPARQRALIASGNARRLFSL